MEVKLDVDLATIEIKKLTTCEYEGFKRLCDNIEDSDYSMGHFPGRLVIDGNDVKIVFAPE